ncbi:hypothetical protein M6B38_153355 [Iris pallida]|uniref:Secreted protein n=1 Tax=Iris pallida TaxID=29817 RepID=A0AAX6EB55_IRIPA|nr:hypothetical protein M6B38_199300 [Iris pallida]KAJ6811576.1 hypothetical protein M6B38_153355 [Iris pallida]
MPWLLVLLIVVVALVMATVVVEMVEEVVVVVEMVAMVCHKSVTIVACSAMSKSDVWISGINSSMHITCTMKTCNPR